jgi:hypothetical protein
MSVVIKEAARINSMNCLYALLLFGQMLKASLSHFYNLSITA